MTSPTDRINGRPPPLRTIPGWRGALRGGPMARWRGRAARPVPGHDMTRLSTAFEN
ncbi:hypothetical protein IAI18_14840 [Acetobacteraceae bacterium H6797]|nr:hypothetical protein [Acetobacteraceae bacterium H6797]